MSELQTGLLVLGALAVAGVLLFNKVQEMRARRDGAKHFGSAHDDVLLGGGAAAGAGLREGALDSRRAAAGVAADAAGQAQAAALVQAEPHAERNAERSADSAEPDAQRIAQRIEPVWNDDATVPAAETKAKTGVAAPILDPRIDFIAELVFADPVPGSHLMLELEKLPRGRNIDADGFNEWAQAWEMLSREAVYEKARAGIQISDRNGPLRADELEAFQTSITALAATLGAQVAWPDEQSPLTRAVELDAFCAGVDVQIGINVVAAAPFADTKLRGLAEANGFTREDDGVFRRRDDEGGTLLTLKQPAPEALSLALDVPRVPREAAALALMAQCAKRFGAGIDGKLVDDNGKPLNDAAISAIQSSLATIYGRMQAAGMPAGGVLARRVFS